MNNITLAPMPKQLEMKKGEFLFPVSGYVSVDNIELLRSVEISLRKHLSFLEVVKGEYGHEKPVVCISCSRKLKNEEYILEITEEEIYIQYGSPAAAFYGMMTLNQLASGGRYLPCLRIHDYPDIAVRGYMLDIARNKVPRVESILELIDHIASVKMNHFELYMEGAPFAYRNHFNMWENTDVLTGEDICRIDRYCKERFIDFVPNHNTFGHMAKWLEKLPRDMAIAPDGFYYAPWNLHYDKPTSLNPLNPESIEFVKEISDDLLSYYSSDKFNVGCDEVLDLGSGVTAGMTVEELGEVYYGYLMKLHDYCVSKNKTMLFWGDAIFHYAGTAEKFPKDVAALVWGYEEDDPKEEYCMRCSENGIPFYVCPGTGGWKTYTGKTRQMLGNAETAVRLGIKYGADGLLLTDWGDGGHLQGFAVCLPGIVFSASLSWGYGENRNMNLAGALSRLIFGEHDDEFGQFMLEAGNYYMQEVGHPINATVTESLLGGLQDMTVCGVGLIYEVATHEDLNRVEDYVRHCRKKLGLFTVSADKERRNILREYNVGFETVLLAQMCGHYKLYFHENDIENQKKCLKYISEKVPFIVGEYRSTWIVKNYRSGIDESLKPVLDLKSQAEELLKELN